MNLLTVNQAFDGGAAKCASNLSGWWRTRLWETPGSLVKLRNTIIAHPSLISRPSSPLHSLSGTHPAIIITAGVQIEGIKSSALQK